MKRSNDFPEGHRFPEERPEIEVIEGSGKPFDVDCRELGWWFGVPVLGDHTVWVTYDLDASKWKLTSVTDMKAVRSAKIHDISGVEIDVCEWESGPGWKNAWTLYGTLTEEVVRWLAVARSTDSEFLLRTFLDQDFERDWWDQVRHIEDLGRLQRNCDGTYSQADESPKALGAGLYTVRIGDKRFSCLRVIDTGDGPSDDGILVEAFLNQAGRTVLFRRYNGLRWQRSEGQPSWDADLPGNAKITVDGITYVHWYDCLTNQAIDE